jgi:hypothetical protein
MVRRSTWFALVVLAALIGFAVYLRKGGGAASVETLTPPTAESQKLFDPKEGIPTSIAIVSAAGSSVDFELENHNWVVKKPFEGAADFGQAEAAATQVTALQNLGNVDVAPADVGLAKPAYAMTVSLTGGSRHTLTVGDKTPSGAGYYARLDEGKVLIVSADGIDSLVGLLASPPYQETLTPSPVPPTGTPAPVGATETPGAATGTPRP